MSTAMFYILIVNESFAETHTSWGAASRARRQHEAAGSKVRIVEKQTVQEADAFLLKFHA